MKAEKFVLVSDTHGIRTSDDPASLASHLTEQQITSFLASRLQTDPNLQQDNQPLIYGKSQRGMFNANIGIIVSVGVDAEGQPDIEIVSADFGPLPAPEGLKDTIEAMVREAYTGSLGPVATGLRIETITIANGIMTVTGRIR